MKIEGKHFVRQAFGIKYKGRRARLKSTLELWWDETGEGERNTKNRDDKKTQRLLERKNLKKHRGQALR